MRPTPSRIVFVTGFTVALNVSGAVSLMAEKTENSAGSTILDQDFRILSIADNKALGVRRLQASDDGKAVEIVETATMDFHDKKVGWTSTVIYPKERPVLKASAETTVDGERRMEGSVSFDHAKGVLQMSGNFIKDGQVSPLPLPTGDVSIAKGTILFQSALSVIGPQLLREPGTIDEIVLAEFPDDVHGLVQFKEGFRLERTAMDSDGGFTLKLHGPHGTDPVATVTFDGQGNVVSEDLGKLRYSPAP